MICKRWPVPFILYSQKWELRETAARIRQDRFKRQSVKCQSCCMVFHYTTLRLLVTAFFFQRKDRLAQMRKSSKANMMPNFEAFCLEFIAIVDIEKVLYFHGLMNMWVSKPFTSKGSLASSQKMWKPRNVLAGIIMNNFLCQSRGVWRQECLFLTLTLHRVLVCRRWSLN